MADFSAYSEVASLRYHWGAVYDIRQASQQKWVAVARWGSRDTLTAGTAEQLRQRIWRHYSPGTAGYSEAMKLGR